MKNVDRRTWAGVLSRDGSGPGTLLRQMLGLRAQDALSGHTPNGAAAIGPQVRRGDVAMARVNGMLLCLDGRIDNRAELADHLRLPRHVPLLRLLATAYEEFAAGLPARLEGDFALAVVDIPRGALLLARDAVGARPLYYAQPSGSVVFATAIKPLRQALHRTPMPRLDAVAQLLCAPAALAHDETFLAGIHALPPAHLLFSTSTCTRVQQYWKAPGFEYERMNFSECVEEYGRLFRQAVRRRVATTGRTAVLVSGGLDSSSVFCAAHEAGADVVGLYHGTHDGSAADESRFVQLLAQTGRPIESVTLEPPGYPELVAGSVHDSEAPIPDYHPALNLRISGAARAAGATTILNGTWADQVLFPFPPGYYLDALRGWRWPQLYAHVRGLPDWFADVPRAELWRSVGRHLLRASLPAGFLRSWQRLRGRAGLTRILDMRWQKSVRAPAAPVAEWSDNRSAHAQAVEQHVRSRLDTLTLEWYAKAAVEQGVQAGLPFLDRELLTLLITAPGLAQTNGGTPKALLRASMRDTVPAAILERRSKGDYTALTLSALHAAAPRVFEALRNGHVRAFGLLDARAFRGDLALFSRQAHIGESDTALTLASLYAVECWFRQFCDI